MQILLQKAKGGDSKAIKTIIDKFTPLILKEASRYYIKDYDYEDLVQHGYLSVIKAINMYKDPRKNFNAYCIKSIKTNFKALLKKEIKHFREVGNENISQMNDSQYRFTVEDEVIAYDEVKRVYKGLEQLSKEEKDIIEKFYLQHQLLDEVAAATNRTNNNIRYRKSRIIKKLKGILEKHI